MALFFRKKGEVKKSQRTLILFSFTVTSELSFGHILLSALPHFAHVYFISFSKIFLALFLGLALFCFLKSFGTFFSKKGEGGGDGSPRIVKCPA